MPSKKQYNLVNDDAYDCRIPLYNEEAFHHGITFHAKYIGSLDVPRPTSRVEIVAAMRRIRYEFKSKSVKKKKVSITISVDGVKVVLRNKKKSSQWLWDENKFIIMHHPIYRIFYVSHDSQDLKIFSYIARDGGTNSFKCNVFKSKKKSQAMRIVRTVGQAFEVCHKLSLALASSQGCSSLPEEVDFTQLPEHSHKGDGASEPNSCDTQAEEASSSKCHDSMPSTQENNSALKKYQNDKGALVSEAGVFGLNQQIQLLKNQLQAQTQHIETITSQLQLMKDQLAAEAAARLQSQAQNEHLLQCNRELLDQIAKLVRHHHGADSKIHSGSDGDASHLPDLSPLPKILSAVSNSVSFPSSLSNATHANKSSPNRRNLEPLLSSAHDHSLNENSLDRSLSSSSFAFLNSSNSPQLESRHFYLTGQSLPGSPSRRSFLVGNESHGKSQSPISNRPNRPFEDFASTLNSKDRPFEDFASTLNSKERPFVEFASTLNSKESDAPPIYQENPSPSYLKNRHKAVDSNNSLFKNSNGDKTSPTVNDLFTLHSISDSKFRSSNSPSANDSFIANVARDLAKLNVSQNSPITPDTHFTKLFSKS